MRDKPAFLRFRHGQLLITCEHGGNDVPEEFRHLFRGHEDVLASHRGFDSGALHVAKRLAAELGAPLFHSTVTRLLVEPNRSLHHRSLFSEYSRVLNRDQRADVLRRFYEPYRDRVRKAINEQVRAGRTVLQLAVHSFVPELNREIRSADVGLLYDPARQPEVEWCAGLRTAVVQQNPAIRVRRNYPYLGTADGFTTYLRKLWQPTQYLGVELELNQGLLREATEADRLTDVIVQAVRSSIGANRAVPGPD